MKWFEKWFFKQSQKAWNNRDQYEAEAYVNKTRQDKLSMGIGTAMVERGRPEGENRINFELSFAVGGKILNVRHYDERRDRHEHQTYVIPNGEDIGERVAKIINLEMIKQ
jgi:hypothetical protein